MQVGVNRATRRAVLLSQLGVAIEKIGIGGFEFFQFLARDEIMYGLVVAFAHLDEVRRIIAAARTLPDVIAKIAALPPHIRRVLIERFKQRENFLKLLLRELFSVHKTF